MDYFNVFKMNNYILNNTNETKYIIEKYIYPLINQKKNNIIIFLNGPVGVGKTFISKHIISKFGFNIKNIISPTYCIINEYINKNYNIYHMDMYRIKDINMLNNIDIFHYINSNSIIFIEWAHKEIKNYINKNSNKFLLEINMNFHETNKRKILIQEVINNQ